MYVGPVSSSHLTVSLSRTHCQRKREGKPKKEKKRRLAQIEKLKLSTRTAAGFVETSFGVAFLDLTMIG